MQRALDISLALLLMLVAAASAHADVIHYKDGRKLEGVIVERSASSLRVETSFGSIDVALSKIDHIEERLTPGQELAQRRGQIADDDAGALWVLATWADEHRLRKQHQSLVHAVLLAAPEHEGANLVLGRVRVDGLWMEPNEVEAYRERLADERRAQGLVLHEGAWVPEAEANRARGLTLLDGQWMPKREAHRQQALTDLEHLGGWKAHASGGEFVTIISELDQDTVKFLIYDLDAAVRDFLRRAQPNPRERKRLVGLDIPIFLLPDRALSIKLLEAGFFDRYPLFADAKQRFAQLPAYGMNWPRPFLVLVEGQQLAKNGDPDTARLGLLGHQLGRLFIDRMKGERSAPVWATTGFAAYYEGVTNYYQTVSISTEGEDDDGDPEGQWVHGWEHYGEWRDQLLDESVQRTLPALRSLFSDASGGYDSREVGMLWSVTRFLLQKHERELFHYLRVFDSNPFELASNLAVEHERAWNASFADGIDELEAEWRDWALVQPRRFPTDELGR
ncbi:MAG: hypothetical protein DRQ55_05335 [Planctomycetota bacterium]|nr:MAG: hypothetical protein DRQ55_05335 [Planctomycetota bacterium]